MFKNYSIYIGFSLVIILFSCTNASTSEVPIKHQMNISIDGMFDAKEWKHSRIIDVAQKNTMHLIQNEDYLFLGIKNTESVARYVDLYIENDSIGTINFHSSMQLSERSLGDVWNDTIPKWNWGNNSNWTANKVKTISNDETVPFIETVARYDGFEFKIAKSKLKSSTSKIRLEIKDFIGEEKGIIFPIDSQRFDTKNWFHLELY